MHINSDDDNDGTAIENRANEPDDCGELQLKRVRQSQATHEREIVKLINRTMEKHGNHAITIELDDVGLRMCSIMGKKKYWKVIGSNEAEKSNRHNSRTFVTKGFEKNVQSFVKHIVRVLQINTLEYINRFFLSGATGATEGSRCASVRAFRFVIDDVRAFFCAVYSALHEYCRLYGIKSFAFGVKLNPRTTGVNRAEAGLIQDTLSLIILLSAIGLDACSL